MCEGRPEIQPHQAHRCREHIALFAAVGAAIGILIEIHSEPAGRANRADPGECLRGEHSGQRHGGLDVVNLGHASSAPAFPRIVVRVAMVVTEPFRTAAMRR